MQIDLRVLELLSSKLCHDLISPVSAINNGVELIEDIGGDVVNEAMNLIGNSARQAAHRLRLFRFAYGRAGGEANLPVKDVRLVLEQYFESTKITITWPDEVIDARFIEHKGGMKLLVNLAMLAEETLAYGGSITVASLSREGQSGCRLEVVGRNAQLAEPYALAMAGTVPLEEITPRSIQSYITGKFAEHYGLKIEHEQPVADRLDLILSITTV